MSEFSKEGKDQVKQWLLDASQAAEQFDGSEGSEYELFEPLTLFDDFVRAHADDSIGSEHEQKVAKVAFPDHPVDMPLTVDGFLDVAAEFYDRLKSTGTSQGSSDVWTILENSGAEVNTSDRVFVKTGEGQLQEGQSSNPNIYEVKTEPRLAMLITHLRNDGVNGQSIYMDDLVITQGGVDANMMREYPYNIVQIPRLDMEVAVCDQINETTFVKKGTVGSEFWDYLSKDQLKARSDVENIDNHNRDQWWNDISEFLSGNAEPTAEKVNVRAWSNRKPKLDTDLVKQSLFAHRLATGEWLSSKDKSANGKSGSYILEHGLYTVQTTASALDAALRGGFRGLTGGSSIAKLNAEISNEHGLDYHNHMDQEDLDIGLIKESLLAHRQATGDWLSPTEKPKSGRKGSFILKYGHYAGEMKAGTLNNILVKGGRGISGGSSIAKLNAEISNEYGLDYHNHMDQEDLDIGLIREGLLAHRQATGGWLSHSKKGDNNKKGSYILEHGHYAGQLTSGNLNNLLRFGLRGLIGGSSIAQLNKELKVEIENAALASIDADLEDIENVPSVE